MSKIVDLFEETCNKYNDKVAFYYTKKRKVLSKTFNDVQTDLNDTINYLTYIGVKKNDKLFAFAESNYELVILIMAAFKIGATVMYIDILARQENFINLFKEYLPDYIIVSNKTKYLRIFFKEMNKVKKIINISNIRKVKNVNILNVSDNTPALLTTTTGSTGVPKIVIRTHEDLYNQLILIKNNIYETKKEKIFLTTSFVYIFANLIQGITTVMPSLNLKKSSKYLNNKLSKYKNIPINGIITSPDFCLKTNNIYPNLEYLYFGGAIINYHEAINIAKTFNNAKLIYIYGCTECNLISMNNLNNYIKELKEKNISNLGKIVNGVKVIIDNNDEILVTSNALTNTYLNKVSNKEYHNTHDRGTLIKNELIYYGRSNNYIENLKLYANQIEQMICLNFNINKCAFINKNNNYYLFIENKDNVDLIRKYINIKYNINIIIKYIKKIPCDVKHHTKISYEKLERKIK